MDGIQLSPINRWILKSIEACLVCDSNHLRILLACKLMLSSKSSAHSSGKVELGSASCLLQWDLEGNLKGCQNWQKLIVFDWVLKRPLTSGWDIHMQNEW